MMRSEVGQDGPGLAPSGVRVGPYRLLEPLGRGGVALVYRAVDERTGQTVALKTVRMASEANLASVRREIHALGRIRHPSIVRILEGGIADGRPWYAMELLEGRTLSEHLFARSPGFVSKTTEDTLSPLPPRAGSGPQTANDVALGSGVDPRSISTRPLVVPAFTGDERMWFLTLVRRLCEPLAYLHGEGFIHRDVKPSNIWVRHDAAPVLMDFGLVWLLQEEDSREILAVDAARGGTISYMAPEQARGERIDARADLFSLGCILYEGLTGRRPFPATTRSELIAVHARLPPPPSRLVDGVTAPLDELVMGMLALQPRDRIGHASDVAAMLAGLGADDTPPNERPASKAYLYRPKLVGRGAPLDEAMTLVTRLRDGHGGCLLVAGESGIGKTSFVSAVAHLSAGRGIRVVTGECAAVGVVEGRGLRQGGPLYPFVRLLQAVGDRCTSGGPELAAKVLGERAKILATIEPSLRLVPGLAETPEPADVPGDAARRRLIDAMAETLTAFARDRPTLLILDDLQWADDLTLALLGALTERYYQTNAISIVATYRSEESTPELDRLATSSHVAHMRLDRLDAATIGAMASDMLGQREVPANLAAFLTQESSGNPFFVAEYLRAAVDARLLFRDARGRWQQAEGAVQLDRLGLPRTLQSLVARRLDSLEDATRRLAELGAVLGREVQVDLVCALAVGDGIVPDEGAFEERLRHLQVRQVLEETSSRSVRFVHDKLREIAYAGLTPERQVALHGAAAALLERLHGEAGTLESVSATLAHHFEKAGDRSKALVYFDKAGEAAHSVYANLEAYRLLARARELDDVAETRSSAFERARRERLLGLNALALGNLNGALASLTETTNIAGRPWPRTRAGLVARSFLAFAEEVGRRLLFDSADRATTEAAPDRSLLLEAARAYERLMVVHYYATTDLLACGLAALTSTGLAERAGADSGELALGYSGLATMFAMVPLDGVARRYARLAVATAARAGDEVGESWVLMNVSMVELLAGRWPETRDVLERVRALSRRLGFNRRWEECMAEYGTALFLSGDFQKCEEINDELRSSIERADPQTKCWAVVKSAELALVRGEPVAALTAAQDGVSMCENNLGRAEWIYTLGSLALARLRTGDVAGARIAADQCMDWIAKGSAPIFYHVFSYGAVAEVYRELWARAAAATDKQTLAASLRRSVKCLRANGRAMKIAGPRASLWRGFEAVLLDGAVDRGLRLFRDSLARARRLAMPFDEGMALAALGEFGHDAAEKQRALGDAADIFAKLGAAHESERVARFRGRI
jgi:eukaryotic-like serine/threonine-protein kinase